MRRHLNGASVESPLLETRFASEIIAVFYPPGESLTGRTESAAEHDFGRRVP